jgi:hypothetical protein
VALSSDQEASAGSRQPGTSPAPGPCRAVEIRVHGVGGTPPEVMLGTAAPTDLVRVGGDGKSAFYARREKGRWVEGYHWGPLTSAALLQPLWIFLLPFTLFNVGGWMLPPKSASKLSGRGWNLARILILALGVTLTASYVLGASTIVVGEVFYQWGLKGVLPNDPHVRLLCGAGAMTLLLILVFRVVAMGQERYEGVQFTGKEQNRGEGVGAKQRSPFDAKPGLIDGDFWARPKWAQQLLWTHLLFAVATLALLVVTAYRSVPAGTLAQGQADDFGWTRLFAFLGLLQVGLAAAFLVVCLVGFRDPIRTFVTGGARRSGGRRSGGFRAFGPLATFFTANGLLSGFFAGLSVITARAMKVEVGESPHGRLGFAFGLSSLSFVAVAVAIFLYLWFRKGAQEYRAIVDAGKPRSVDVADPPGWEPSGLPQASVRALGRARALSEFIRNVDLVLTVPALVFVPIAVGTFSELLHAGSASGPFTARLGAIPGLQGMSTLGHSIALLGTGTLLTLLWRSAFQVQRRRSIGMLWDILTFWPRRFHPLAIRPYAERAVPELEGRINFHLDPEASGEHRRVLLSAHSQGTVVAFAVLCQMAARKPEDLSNVALVTYGAPLTQLYGRFFPAYFNPEVFGEVRGMLFGSTDPVRDGRPRWGWRNFYRLTDYIGKKVEVGGDDGSAAVDGFNSVVPDPPEEPCTRPVPLDEPWPGFPDLPLIPWIALSRHSNYNQEPALKDWVAKVESALVAAP